jgi:hypothetical protein
MTFPWFELVVIGDEAWIDEMESGWTPVPPDDPGARLCPGSSLFWEGFLPLENLAGIERHLDLSKAVPAMRLSLIGWVQSLPSAFGSISEGATVNTFNIWVAQDGGWLVALEFDGTVDGEPTQIRVDVTNPNDPTISVNAP